MIKLNEIPLDYEPRKKIILKLKTFFEDANKAILMSALESAFLSGLIKVARPKKILEVGVAAGGTTAIVLQSLEDIGVPYEMHSVDLREKHFSYKTKHIGFLAEIAKENNLFASQSTLDECKYPLENNFYTPPPSTLCGKHKFYLGKYLPQVSKEIGSDIDFVILDTAHYVPGELLDFPVMLPYLKNGAIVVLHDVSLNQIDPKCRDAFATGLLLSAVTASEKFLNSTLANNFAYPNIGAFRVDDSTRQHIENVFLAFMLNWHYIPSDVELNIYRTFYSKHYSADFVNIFNAAVNFNSQYMAKQK